MPQDNLLKKIKELREITGVGFKDCKSAIDETKGDIEKSIVLLRKLIASFKNSSSVWSARPSATIIPAIELANQFFSVDDMCSTSGSCICIIL